MGNVCINAGEAEFVSAGEVQRHEEASGTWNVLGGVYL